MRNKRNPWILIILLIFGALAGGFAGEFLVQYPYMSWIGFGGVNGYRELFSFSFNPLIDFKVFKFGFDLALRINAGSIIGMISGFLVFLKL
jgi:hypothetical protein